MERWRSVEEELTRQLSLVEGPTTTRQELSWCSAALDVTPRAMERLGSARPLGEVLVTLPATLPLYSTLLFGASAALPGNKVWLRPSGRNVDITRLMVEEVLTPLGLDITVVDQRWDAFAASHPEPDGVLFTGSYDHVSALERALDTRTVLAYQGSGNCAAIVSPGADLDDAAATIVRDRCFNSGQDCLSTERVYVHEDVLHDFEARLVHAARGLVTSSHFSEDADLHPLAHAGRFRRLRRLSIDRSERLLVDGGEKEPDLFGLTITESSPNSLEVLSESYGPLLHVVAWQDERELRSMLLRGSLALGLSVWGPIPSFGTLDFAQVAIDSSLYEYEDFLAAFGGYRRSSFVRRPTRCSTGPFWVPDVLSIDEEDL
ncbi:aldehyde dehydrogenase family protein [Clavibacter michiganensis]